MKDSATQSKKVEPKIYKSKEELFADKREQMNKALSKVDPKQLEAFLSKNQH